MSHGAASWIDTRIVLKTFLMIAESTWEKLETLSVAIQRVWSPGPLFKDVSLRGGGHILQGI